MNKRVWRRWNADDDDVVVFNKQSPHALTHHHSLAITYNIQCTTTFILLALFTYQYL